MTLEPKRYRAHQEIVAVRLTDDNLAEVAEWCTGSVVEDGDGPFGVDVNDCNFAGVGDWVVEGSPDQEFEVIDDQEFRFYDFQEVE